MTHGSLFSGIGGFDLAAEWMGWENVFHCEFAKYPSAILKQNFPNSIPYHDIKKTDFTIHRGKIDILTGGFPCQPYSLAGKRKGKEDDRHLWPEMLRAIQEIQPPWVVGENVFGIVNWDGGVVFDEVQTDLEAKGYEVQPFILPAASVNAPHRRDRVWFIAYSNNYARRRTIGSGETENQTEWRNLQFLFTGPGEIGVTSDTNSVRQYRSKCKDEVDTGERGEHAFCNTYTCFGYGFITNTKNTNERLSGRTESENAKSGIIGEHEYVADNICFGCDEMELRPKPTIGKVYRSTCADRSIGNWNQWPSKSGVCGGNDGVPNRVDRIKALGNAIVPQVALQIFKTIKKYQDAN